MSLNEQTDQTLDTNVDNQLNAAGAGDQPGNEPAATDRPLSAREIAMNAIVVDREGFVPPDTNDAADKDPKAIDPQLEAQLDAPKILTDGLDKVMVKIKVDGVESEVSVAELTTNYQKGSAADRRLQEATTLLREARAISAAPTPPVGIPAGAPTPEDTQALKPALGEGQKEFVSALFEGDEEKALAALAKLGIGRTDVPTQVDPQQLLRQLTPAVKQQLDQEIALDTFSKTYADIVSDPYLAQMADGFHEAEMKNGKSFTEALEAAGTKTRDWLASKGVRAPAPAPAPAEPVPTDVRTQKLERKAAIDNVAALNTSAVSQEQPVQTPSQVIEEMRKARGL